MERTIPDSSIEVKPMMAKLVTNEIIFAMVNIRITFLSDAPYVVNTSLGCDGYIFLKNLMMSLRQQL